MMYPHEPGAFFHGDRHRDLSVTRFIQGPGRPADRQAEELPADGGLGRDLHARRGRMLQLCI